MAVGFGLRAFKARLPPGSPGNGCGYPVCVLYERAFPDARLETAPTGGGFCVFCERAFRGRGWKPRLPVGYFVCFASARPSWESRHL